MAATDVCAQAARRVAWLAAAPCCVPDNPAQRRFGLLIGSNCHSAAVRTRRFSRHG